MKITAADIFNFTFYKYKNPFTGSCEGMRYRIRRIVRELETETDGKKDELKLFEVCTWPEPFAYAATDPEKITTVEFPFDEDGYNQVIEHLNAELEKY